MRQKAAGFTLMEVVVVIAVTAVLGLVITEFYLGQNQSYRRQMADLDLNYEARLALDQIDADVRAAASVAGSYGSYSTDAQTLILQIQSVNASNQLIPGTYDHAVIHLDGSRLLRRLEPDASSSREPQVKLLSENIGSVNFAYDNADLAQVTEVQTDLELSKNLGREIRNLSISSKAVLRN